MNRNIFLVTGAVAPLFLWIGVKLVFDVSDRYLPGPMSVIAAVNDIGWPLAWHVGATLARTATGFVLGVGGGIALALAAFRLRLFPMLMPTINGLRAVPAIATVPFFLLWFGFSEIGRYLLVALGLGLNIVVACADVLERPDEKDIVIFRNFQLPRESLILTYWLPRLAETLLPTLRFGLSLALGLIAVSEMLGAQYGLGYLMQTARATFSLNVLILCALILGVIATAADSLVRWTWTHSVRWRR